MSLPEINRFIQIFIDYKPMIMYNINQVLVLLLIPVSLIYVFVYYIILKAPFNWMTQACLIFTWVCSICTIAMVMMMLVIKKHKMKHGFVRHLRATHPPLIVFSWSIVVIGAISVLIKHGHIITASVTGLSTVVFGVFVYKFLYCPVSIPTSQKDQEMFLSKILVAWETGDFPLVVRYLDQCSAREIVEITDRVQQRYGDLEADMLKRLLS